MTGLAVKAGKLSRKAGNRDRLGSGSRKAVKITICFQIVTPKKGHQQVEFNGYLYKLNKQ
ncbi:hypothetical protein DYI25_13960 [Mesobacillus boroniphilus]|uniref:Uncharacterized protein n=1 Tax=Mesobacillus boroniphilus TaxID=308892 RepID=A0A944CLW7_9BACI|nr:hypothetical protein [Mesobacillus boroniphilus]